MSEDAAELSECGRAGELEKEEKAEAASEQQSTSTPADGSVPTAVPVSVGARDADE